jgi:hypothetical protein
MLIIAFKAVAMITVQNCVSLFLKAEPNYCSFPASDSIPIVHRCTSQSLCKKLRQTSIVHPPVGIIQRLSGNEPSNFHKYFCIKHSRTCEAPIHGMCRLSSIFWLSLAIFSVVKRM